MQVFSNSYNFLLSAKSDTKSSQEKDLSFKSDIFGKLFQKKSENFDLLENYILLEVETIELSLIVGIIILQRNMLLV